MDISLRWNRRKRRRQDFALRQERRTSDAGPASLQDASLLLARSR